nr:insulinase family protein [Marinomonas ostreistagni]
MQTIHGKSLSDSNEYATLTLDNGLTVILVSDPNAERSAASLAVGAGNYQDPNEHAGIAHLLEHMLFLGTEKYPEADAYQAFIRAKGGSHNAYTSAQLTNYYFDILPDHYSEALDRFAQFFISPTLDAQYIEREIHAVDAEYRAKLNDENRRSHESLKQLYNPKHPASRFTVGNLDTLGNLETSELRKSLKEFYQAHYTPDNMVLTLVAKQPLELLEGYARQYFDGITNHHVASSSAALPTLVTQPKTIQFFKTNTEKNVVKLLFPIDSQTQNYASQPTRYLSYVLGDESQNSVFADLKRNGWAQSLHVSLKQDDGQQAMFAITLSLTEAGVTQRDQVIARLFKAINNLRQADISSDYLDEIQTLSALNFEHRDYVAPMRLAQVLSSRALDVSATELLNSFHITQHAPDAAIERLLQQLDPDQVIVQWQSDRLFPDNWAQNESKWRTEPLYNGQYRQSLLTKDWPYRQLTEPLSDRYGLPDSNPFIPKDLSLLGQTDAQPQRLTEQSGFDFWYRANGQYQNPNGMIFGYFGFLEDPSRRDCLTLQLWARLFSDATSESTYQPFMAGLGYQLYPHRNGLTLRTNGYSDKQAEFFEQMIEKLMAFRATPERLELAREEVAKGLRNLDSQPPYALARHYFSQVAVKGNSSIELMQQQLADISLEEINQFIERQLQTFHFTGYMTGNFTATQAQQLSQTMQTNLAPKLGEHAYQYVQLNEFEPSKRYIFPFETSSSDSTVLYNLIAADTNDASYQERAYVRILSQLLSARFYHEFRTEKQYGYIVAVTNQTIEKTPAIGFLVQSPKISTQKLVNEIERFIDEQEWGDNISQQDFDQAREALLAAFKKPPTSLKEEALREWPHIVEPEHQFDDRDNWIAALEGLDREAFLAYVNEKVEQDQAARLLITNKWQDLDIWQSVAIQ